MNGVNCVYPHPHKGLCWRLRCWCGEVATYGVSGEWRCTACHIGVCPVSFDAKPRGGEVGGVEVLTL